MFVVLKPLRYVEQSSDIETGELMCFVGDRFIVTVRRGEAGPLAGLRHRLEAEPELLRRGPMGVLHGIVDGVVDNYTAHRRGGVLRPRRHRDRGLLRRRHGLVDDLPAQARGAGVPAGGGTPGRAAAWRCTRTRAPHVTDPELRLQFRDVSDHLQAVIDHVESYDRLLTDVLGAHLAQITVQQNTDMRRISAWVAIAAVPTMIAGIYGMNFDYMPELTASIRFGDGEFRYGYFVVLAVMALVCGGLYRAFKRSGWL